jgi:uncharacterized GH25 family protein
MNANRKKTMLTLVLSTMLVTALAHDFWIEPASFSPQAGQILSVRLRVGQELMGDPVARDSSLVNQFVFENADGRKSLVGRDGSDPAGYLRVEGQGLTVIGYFSNPSTVDMPADKFNQYLKDEGLDGILALRARRKQMGEASHELFSRCAKSLVLAGSPGRAQGDRTLGFTLELVAEKNPYALRSGEELPVRLTYQGRALSGALVVAMNKMDPGQKLSARTDAEGRVRFRLPQGGMWLVKSVHMIPGAKADWESYWASLTFELPNTEVSKR